MKVRDILNLIEAAESGHRFQHLYAGIDDGYYGKLEGAMIKDFDNISTKSRINVNEAAMLIATNDDLFDAIDSYKACNKPLSKAATTDLIDILNKVVPIDRVFYRGTDTKSYDDRHVMAVQSWSLNVQTAKMFGPYIWQTVGSVIGVELSDIYYWRGVLFEEGNGLGDSQAEWLLLPPEHKNLIVEV